MKRMSHSAGPWLLTLYPFLLLWFILGVPATTGAFAPPAFQFFALAVSVLTIGLTVYWLFLAFRPARPDGWWRPRRRDWIVACIVWIAGIAGLVRLVNRVLEQTRAVNIANRGANTVWALQKRVKTHAMLASLGEYGARLLQVFFDVDRENPEFAAAVAKIAAAGGDVAGRRGVPAAGRFRASGSRPTTGLQVFWRMDRSARGVPTTSSSARLADRSLPPGMPSSRPTGVSGTASPASTAARRTTRRSCGRPTSAASCRRTSPAPIRPVLAPGRTASTGNGSPASARTSS